MKKLREIAGYVLGGVMFVLLLPTIMWLVSGSPDLAVHIGALRASFTGLLMLGGLSLSVWTIVHMKTHKTVLTFYISSKITPNYFPLRQKVRTCFAYVIYLL